MINIEELISKELGININNITNALKLAGEGSTIPFIARYRKEMTGELNEIQLRDIFDRNEYLTEIEERKKTILNTISEQGKLTDELKEKIENCILKNELEDLYLPYKPKKKTRASVAKEKGLSPLAETIKLYNSLIMKGLNLIVEATKYIDIEKGITTAEEALKGAGDIIAEEISEIAEYRAFIRNLIQEEGTFSSTIKDEFPEGTTKYEMYRKYSCQVKLIAPHNMLALRRGEKENILNYEVVYDILKILNYLKDEIILTKDKELRAFYDETIEDAYNRLMKNSIIAEIRLGKKEFADIESIKTFAENLKNLLLASPAGMKPTIGIDPGFRTGCKMAIMDNTGKYLEYKTVFPFFNEEARNSAKNDLLFYIKKYHIELIAIGNGTASRETDEFVTAALSELDKKPVKVIVSESGASVYSASQAAIDEFPELDLTVRGAISIGRRLQDPLSELVKIDPKSIGVGQYQHDVEQKLLKKKLEETVESCVNYVGVDLNLASKELLSYVSGINQSIAKKLVEYRNKNGAFSDREQIKKISGLGVKAFEQAAGFLRIRGGKNPLDNSSVHPESYDIVNQILMDLKISIEEIAKAKESIDKIDLKKYVNEKVGIPTLRDIIEELKKPGRDPRSEFKYASFNEGIKEISDLKIGMELEGIVTNVANFGVFVDIGVHQDGLVHKSQVADRFVEDPKTIVKVGQIVKVKVLEVNEKLKRVSLTMKSGNQDKNKKNFSKAEEKTNYSINDLLNKFKKN